MEYTELLAAVAHEFSLPALQCDESGQCAIQIDGHPVFITQMQQPDPACVLLSTALPPVEAQTDELLEELLAANLFSQGLQFAALDDGTVIMNRSLLLADLSTSHALKSVHHFGHHLTHWRDRLQTLGDTDDPA